MYDSSYLQGAGLDVAEAQRATLLMGVVTVAMTFVSLILIESAGRWVL